MSSDGNKAEDSPADATAEDGKAEGSPAASTAESGEAEGSGAAAVKHQQGKGLLAPTAVDDNAKGSREHDTADESKKAEGVVTAMDPGHEQNTTPGVEANVPTQCSSVSEASALVRCTSETIQIFVDPASQKAIDGVIAGMNAPMFKEICSALVEADRRSSFACSRLLEWSSVHINQNLLSEDEFLQIANFQVELCQIVMAGKAKRQRYCKRIFLSLFKSSEVLRMYLAVVTGLNFQTNSSSSFVKLLLDYTAAKPQLFLVYKDELLKFYLRAVLDPDGQVKPKMTSAAFQAFLSKIDFQDFQRLLFVPCLRILSEDAEIIALQSIQYLLDCLSFDSREYSAMIIPNLLMLSRHQDEQRRLHALNIIGTLCEKCDQKEALSYMLNFIRNTISGSDGGWSRPDQRIGVVNALGKLSRSSAMKPRSETIEQRSIVETSVSTLMTCYKDDDIREVKLAILSALRSWMSVSIEAVRPELVSFLKMGLQEKDYKLRAGHLRLVKVVCKCPDSLTKAIPLFDQLTEVAKQSFSNAEHVDAIYALYGISKIIAVHQKTRTLREDDFWALIHQNGNSFFSVQLLSELSEENCSTVLDLLKSLLVEHISRVRGYSYTHLLLQILIHLACHSNWRVRKVAYGAVKDVLLAGSAVLADDLLDFLIDWLSSPGDTKLTFENGDAQTEVLVKCLILVGSCTLKHFPKAYSKLLLCCHHPYVAKSDHPGLVWKRLVKSLKLYRIIHVDLPMIQATMKELLSHVGSRSNEQISVAVFNSLQTLTQVVPNDAPMRGQGIEHHLSPPIVPPALEEMVPPGVIHSKDISADTGAAAANEQKNSMFPMSIKAFISFLKASSNAAVGAMTTATVFLATTSSSIMGKLALGVTLFAFLPWAVATAGVAHSAEDDDKWLGCAATMVLIEFIYVICLGAVTGTALPMAQASAVVSIAVCLVLFVVYTWSWVFSEPKWVKKIQLWLSNPDMPRQEKTVQDMPQSFMSRLKKWFKTGEAQRQQEDTEQHQLHIKVEQAP